MTLHEIDLFIALLENGLLDRRVRTLTGKTPTPQEWEHIYEAARIHAVSAVLFDGLQTLPPEWRPPRPLYLQWAARTVQIEQANLRLQEVTARIVECYDQAGLHPVLLKGSSIGRHYPNPLHRQCGDIDLYIGKRDFARANRLLEQLGGVVTAETADKHSHYLLEGVHVENHRRLLPMGNPLHTRRLRKMI
ncbi:MAG: nucleotidyltransferase family protein, partial [Prevotellaceae bacterium]|nr:nucleotidyltransferase family protein [Prevotellaceae bacterium]